ncbi:MAG TPA: c-type cytochrome [Vicinamibacterales bacterium]|nr:c-type cytochrome [Vicinamibacterales bacterium]
MTNRSFLTAVLVAASALAVTMTAAGCRNQGREVAAASVPGFLDVSLPPHPPTTPAVLARGKELYDVNCAHCHGEKGDGAGYGAPFLVPAPRDFVAAQYKFRTTASGQLPTDEDIFRTISRGATGTGMPPWQYLLDDNDRWALVDYVKSFSPRLQTSGPRPVMAIARPPSEHRDIENGRQVYVKMQCAKCHGDDGRGVGPSSATLLDSKGKYINTRDFTFAMSYRTGFSEREIVRTMETGMNGTPMPSYTGVISPKDQHDMVAYLMTMAAHGSGNQRRQSARSMEGVGEPARVIAVREHAWKFEPAEIRIKAGEVVKIEFSTTDNGLGAGHGFALDGFDQQVFMNGAMVGASLSTTFKIDEPGRYNFYCSTQCSTTDLHPHMHGTLVVE